MNSHCRPFLPCCVSSLTLILFASLLAVGPPVAPVLAQTEVIATSTTGGNWTDTSTWTCSPSIPACIPNDSSADTFNVSSDDGTVALNSSSSLVTVTVAQVAIGSSGSLSILDGRTLNVTSSVSNSNPSGPGPAGGLFVDLDLGSPGGSVVNIGGNLVNGPSSGFANAAIGNSSMDLPSEINVGGTFSNTGDLSLEGGSQASASALLNVGGAAPSTLGGIYDLVGNTGGAAVQFGSGGVTAIGSGSYLIESGSNAYLEMSTARGGNSALTGLTAVNGDLDLFGGAEVTANGDLTNAGSVLISNSSSLNVAGSFTNDFVTYLDSDSIDAGGGSLGVGGNLTNVDAIFVGSPTMTESATLSTVGRLNNSGLLFVDGGGSAGAQALVDVGGPAPTTLTGIFDIQGNAGGAAVEYGSGAITAIGNATNVGNLALNGSNAYIELSSNTGSNSALTKLATIGSEGFLTLENGATVTTASVSGILTNDGTIDVNSASELSIAGGVINLGTVSASGGTLQIDASALTPQSAVAITNFGAINVGQNARFELNDGGNSDIFELSGGGNVTLSGGYIIGVSTGGNQGTEVLNNEDNTISGPGSIQDMGIVNSGTISENTTGTLDIRPTAALGAVGCKVLSLTCTAQGGGIVNSGTIEASSGGTVEIEASDSPCVGLCIRAGGLHFPLSNSAGGQITLGSTTGITAGSTGTLEINSDGVGGVTLQNDGTIALDNGGILEFNGANTPFSILPSLKVDLSDTTKNTLDDLTSNDITTLSDVGNLAGSALIDVLKGSTFGSGTIQFAGGIIEGSTGSERLIISPFETVEGLLSTSNISIDNLGTIALDIVSFLPTSARLVSNLNLTSGENFINLGNMQVGSGMTFKIVGNQNSLGNFDPSTGVLQDGTYNVAGTWQVDAFGSGGFQTNSATITVSGTGQILNASGTSALTTLEFNSANGTLTLEGGANAVVGDFTNAGTIEIGSGSSLASSGAGSYIQTSGSTDVNGTLIAPAGVKIEGGGLSGGGTISGDVENAALLSPGPSNKLTIDGNYVQDASGTLVIDVLSTTDFSGLDVTASAALDGTLDFDFLDGYVPGANTDFAFLHVNGSVTGDFTSFEFTGITCPSCVFDLSTLSLDTGSTPPRAGTTTPEPSTLALFAIGLLGLAWLSWRRDKAAG